MEIVFEEQKEDKASVCSEEWSKRVGAINVPRSYLNNLIMNFFVSEGNKFQ